MHVSVLMDEFHEKPFRGQVSPQNQKGEVVFCIQKIKCVLEPLMLFALTLFS